MSNNTNKKNCFYANARSIVNKRDELELYVKEEKPQLIGITEAWTNADINNSELNISGYTVFRVDRVEKRY